jgi:uncharacterized membrane protein
MADNDSIVAIYATHTDAEEAVKELQKSSFDMKKLSIVGKDYHTEENVVGYYNTGDRVASWGKAGVFWGWIWGLVFGSAFFFIPGIGPVMAGGPVVSWLIGALETAAVVGGVSAFGAALASVGIPKDSVLKYDTALKASKFLLIAHGTPEEVLKAKAIIDQSKAESSTIHKQLVAAPRS